MKARSVFAAALAAVLFTSVTAEAQLLKRLFGHCGVEHQYSLPIATIPVMPSMPAMPSFPIGGGGAPPAIETYDRWEALRDLLTARFDERRTHLDNVQEHLQAEIEEVHDDVEDVLEGQRLALILAQIQANNRCNNGDDDHIETMGILLQTILSRGQDTEEAVRSGRANSNVNAASILQAIRNIKQNRNDDDSAALLFKLLSQAAGGDGAAVTDPPLAPEASSEGAVASSDCPGACVDLIEQVALSVRDLQEKLHKINQRVTVLEQG